MGRFECSRGCLRDELDEDMEALNDVRIELQDNFESAEPESISPERLAGFKSLINGYKEQFDLYEKHCLKCKKNGGKFERYLQVYNQADELWEILSK